ncbi:acyltransferase [Sagittula sp. NFXS13]|uniref:acyltransferase n=1 Tax=Sagittula sp. NFXS13 TaxID=2819095 RepID=UPI0032DE6DF1
MFGMLNRLVRALGYALGTGIFFVHRLRRNVEVGRRVRVFGVALIDIHSKATLIIEDDVNLNSMARGYHLGMYGGVKLMADRPGATISIGSNTRVHGSCIHAQDSVTIGRNCLIAAQCQIIDGHGHDISADEPANRINTIGETAPIRIEDNVWLGTGVLVMPGVTIGEGTVIGASSVVTRDIPPGVLAVGVPAKVVRTFYP